MKNFHWFVIMPLVLLSCQDIKETPKPKNLIPEEKMVDILTELSLLQGARSYNQNLMNEKGITTDVFVWKKYGVDSLQFVRSNEYYSEHYIQYERIYDSVKSRLERLKVEYDSIREAEERRLDSLRDLRRKDSLPRAGAVRKDSLPANRGRSMPMPVSRRDSLG